MTKKTFSKTVFLFLIAMLGFAGMKAQTCGAPISLTVNTGFTAIDSTNLSLTYYKFTATNTEHSIKFWVKNSDSPVRKFSFKCYTDNCGSLPASEIVSITQRILDTFYIDLPSVSTGTNYLVELQNYTTTYLVNKIRINNRLHSSLTSLALTCPSSFSGCTGSNACDLVCNGSFECHQSPSVGPDGITDGNVFNWNSPTNGTADVLSTAFAFSTQVGSQCNYWGYQSPQQGTSYAGIIWAEAGNDGSEYIQTKLTNTLTAGMLYTATMWVRAGDNNPYQIGISQLGIYLTTGSLSIPINTIIPNTYTPTAVETNTTSLNETIAWKKITLTFTATGGEDHLTIGRPAGSSTFAASQTTFDCGSYPGLNPYAYLYIDNVSLVPTLTISANADFPISCPNAIVTLTATSNNVATTFTWLPGGFTGSVLYVAPPSTSTYTLLASVPGCTATNTASTTIVVTVTPQIISTSANVTICPGYSAALSASASISPATFTWMPGTLIGSSVTVTPTTTTIYTVTGKATNLCNATKTVQVTVLIPGTFTLSTPSNSICTNLGQSSTLTATGTAGLNYTWTPGALNGSVQVVTPSVTTIYTVTALSSGCSVTNTIAVAVQAACCTSTVPALTTTSLTGVTITGPKVINFDLTIYGTNTVTTFQNGEFLIAPNVQITVIGGSQNELRLTGVHMYACGTSMWKGINILDGARIISEKSGSTGNSTLIEDAITAVNLNTVTTAAATIPIEITNTIFNKNYVAIKMSNAPTSTASILLTEDVFTSRSLTFTPTSWPTTSTVSPGLRTAVNATTGLVAPYTLQSAGITNLLNPYSGQSANTAIVLNDVGFTSGGTYTGVEIGRELYTETEFNLFDALMYGIDATNSNVSSVNNVFQNTQRVYLCPSFCYYDGGHAIRANVNSNLNARLNLAAAGTYSTSYSVGNRFWDCHIAVETNNVYALDCKYGTFRSTQTNTNATNSLLFPGEFGILNTTNRFDHNFRYNRFSNIMTALNTNISSGTYTYGASSYSGVLANNMFIDFNFFGAQLTNTTTVGSAFLHNAVYIESNVSSGWNNIATTGLRVSNNEFDKIWRANYITTVSYPTSVENNTVNIVDDGTMGTTQWGVKAGNTPNVIIANNKLNAANTTNTLVTLVYVGSSAGSAVTCNTLSSSWKAFEFNSTCSASLWKGNSMTTHSRGLVLSGTGVIGTQGGASSPIDNKWNSGITDMTYMEASDAANSKLYTKAGSPWQTTANNGNNSSNFWYSWTSPSNTITTTGTYSCGSTPPPQRMVIIQPDQTAAKGIDPNATSNAEMQYIYDNIMYRYLDANPDLKDSVQEYVDFYNNKTGSSIDVFNQTEKALSAGQLAQATSLNNSVNKVNAVENNYSNYYSLYEKFKSSTFSSQDSIALLNLALLCPGTGGPIVYQARSLYNLYTRTLKMFDDNCNAGDQNSLAKLNDDAKLLNSWNVDLFPNPTTGNFNLVSSLKNEVLQVTITDIAGKLIFKNTVNTSNFIANLELNAKAGIYLITVKKSTHESTTKKLVITD